MMAAEDKKAKNQIKSSLTNGKPEPLKVLLTWRSSSRLFKRLSRERFATIGAIVFLVGIILVFLQEWFLIAVIVALTFFSYILSQVKPEEVEHQITNRGIVTSGKTYLWEQLLRFWFESEGEQAILLVDGLERMPFRLLLLLGDQKKETIQKILASYLPEEKPEKTWIDRSGEWITRQIPLEK